MDSTQVFFSMQVPVAEFSNSASVVVPAPGIDLGATIFLAAEKSSKLFGGLFFSLHSSLENAIFHVREGFEKVVVSVTSRIRKFFSRRRSMWRGRIAAANFSGLVRHSAVLVMRT
jgi:hypothetical protein